MKAFYSRKLFHIADELYMVLVLEKTFDVRWLEAFASGDTLGKSSAQDNEKDISIIFTILLLYN